VLLIPLLIGCSDESQQRQDPRSAASAGGDALPVAKPRVLMVNSYHLGYDWTDGIVRAVLEGFDVRRDQQGNLDDSHSAITLRTVYMDTKRRQTPDQIAAAAHTVKEMIEGWQPDLVITSDDNAAKYLIMPYFKEAPLPFVFCGVNWDASEYGFPCSNVTGMIEVQLVDQLVEIMERYASGSRIAILKGDDLSARKEASFFEARLNRSLDKRFVSSFAEWQREYQQLQQEADMILLGNAVSIPDWNPQQAGELIATTTRVPTGNWDVWMAPYSLITVASIPAEQGEFAVQAARRILGGTPPHQIPLGTNHHARIYLNMPLAKQMDIVFPIDLIEQALFVEEQ